MLTKNHQAMLEAVLHLREELEASTCTVLTVTQTETSSNLLMELKIDKPARHFSRTLHRSVMLCNLAMLFPLISGSSWVAKAFTT